jgi:calcineurin-like phosphoesterase family protein
MNNCWLTSDEHYGHNNVIKFCNRPYKDIEEMKEGLIENHNSVVKKGDLVYHLGDIFWRTIPLLEAVSIVKRLNGQHYYVRGNHEELIDHNKNLRDLFIWNKDIAEIHPAGFPKIVLCHYALRTWNGSNRGSWQLYGHSHNGLSRSVQGVTREESALSLDVGVDAWNMFPVSLDEIALKMKEIQDVMKDVPNTFPQGMTRSE